MGLKDVVGERIVEIEARHPDWVLKNEVLELIIGDALSYFDDLDAYLSDYSDPDDFYDMDVKINDENGVCSVIVMTPYEIEVNCLESDFFNVVQHIDSLFICNQEEAGVDSPCLAMLFDYGQLFVV